MIDLARIKIRAGTRPNCYNVDFDHIEIGYLQLSIGRGVTSWAYKIEDKPMLDAVRRFVEPLVSAIVSR